MTRWVGRLFTACSRKASCNDCPTGRPGKASIALLIGRLIPVVAFNLLNYAAAMTHISWWTYIWATGLGILPLTILLNVFGASILTLTTSNWIWILLGVFAVAVWLLARRHSKANKDV